MSDIEAMKALVEKEGNEMRARISKQWKDVDQKILAHLVPASDITTLVLKGHLLLEEEINRTLSGILGNVQPLDDARLSFFQRLQVLRAIDRTNIAAECLDAASALNRIRNRLAHNLENAGIEAEVNGLVDKYDTKIEKTAPLITKFIFFISFITGFLSAVCKANRFLRDPVLQEAFRNREGPVGPQ